MLCHQLPDFGNFTDKPVLEHYLGVIIPVREGGCRWQIKADAVGLQPAVFCRVATSR